MLENMLRRQATEPPNRDNDLHELPDHVPPHHVVEDGLELGVLHQTELDPVPVPSKQRTGLQCRHTYT